jgi:hypothetical protein
MPRYRLNLPLQNQILTNLHVSKDILLEEVTLLLLKQQLAEFQMEIDYFEKKYQQTFTAFDNNFKSSSVSFEIENDWLAWKFAVESQAYWNDLLRQVS